MTFTKPRRRVDKIHIHCSASDNPRADNAEAIRRYHVDHRHWSDIGYHFFIRKNGLLEAGRNLEKTPASASNHNRGAIAICLHGLDIEKFTEAQFATLRKLCWEIDTAYERKVTFHGHREFTSLKTCPVFNYVSVLDLDAKGRLGNMAPPTAPQDPSTPQFHGPLERGDKGDRVVAVQKALHAHDLGPVVGRADGDFGKKTEHAVKVFRAKLLLVSGVIDEQTHQALFNAG